MIVDAYRARGWPPDQGPRSGNQRSDFTTLHIRHESGLGLDVKMLRFLVMQQLRVLTRKTFELRLRNIRRGHQALGLYVGCSDSL